MKVQALYSKNYLGYNDIYLGSPKPNRLDYISGYSKEFLIKLFSVINLHPAINRFSRIKEFKDSPQNDLINGIASQNKPLTIKLAQIIKSKSSVERQAIIFHRPANLIAMAEIIQSDLSDSNMDRKVRFEDILKYYLLINSEIIRGEEVSKSSDRLNNLEKIAATISPVNELGNVDDPLQQVLRSYYLDEFLQTSDSYGKLYNELSWTWGESPGIHASRIVNCITYLLSQDRLEFPLFRASTDSENRFLELMSYRSELTGESPLEALNIKKGPFYKLDENLYCLMDIFFLADKTYYSLVNDFYFDHVKLTGEGLANRSFYNGELGHFFENYVGDLIKFGCRNNVHIPVLATDELNVTISGGTIEIADFYMRKNRKVVLGQAKFSAINSSSKYGGDPVKFYTQHGKSVYEKYGVLQMVKSTLSNLDLLINVDKKFPEKGRIKILPLLVHNERAFKMPAAATLFNSKFRELASSKFGDDIVIPKNTFHEMVLLDRYQIMPLILSSVEAIEIMSILLTDKKFDIWKAAKVYVWRTGMQSPFASYLKMMISQRKLIESLLSKTEPLMQKYEVEISGGT